MTREEAIAKLVAYAFWASEHVPDEVAQALDMAIEALQENESLAKSVNEASELLRKKRPHGEWLSHYEYCKKHDYIPSGLIAFWWCNQCEQGVEIQTNFCPKCGADMRKEGEAE